MHKAAAQQTWVQAQQQLKQQQAEAGLQQMSQQQQQQGEVQMHAHQDRSAAQQKRMQEQQDRWAEEEVRRHEATQLWMRQHVEREQQKQQSQQRAMQQQQAQEQGKQAAQQQRQLQQSDCAQDRSQQQAQHSYDTSESGLKDAQAKLLERQASNHLAKQASIEQARQYQPKVMPQAEKVYYQGQAADQSQWYAHKQWRQQQQQLHDHVGTPEVQMAGHWMNQGTGPFQGISKTSPQQGHAVQAHGMSQWQHNKALARSFGPSGRPILSHGSPAMPDSWAHAQQQHSKMAASSQPMFPQAPRWLQPSV